MSTHVIDDLPCLDWPRPNLDPLGRRTAVALLNPADYAAGHPGHWLAGTLDTVLADLLVEVELRQITGVIRAFDGAGVPTHEIEISRCHP